MNQHVYFNILDHQVLPFSQHLHDEFALATPISQDDNSTVHRAGRICDWFDAHSHTLLHLDWPARSPDLNPMENLWDMLEQRVKRRNQHPLNLVDLRNQIFSEWLKVDATCLQSLVDSLPNRIQAVIKSRGGVTRKNLNSIILPLIMLPRELERFPSSTVAQDNELDSSVRAESYSISPYAWRCLKQEVTSGSEGAEYHNQSVMESVQLATPILARYLEGYTVCIPHLPLPRDTP
ncbi:hypothetical protein AVEN_171943-1 [Araneus ventricosus]|uniref:Tc1-like transposase DDE domain-containing protein n=1 Tax=Araneus ventricosus TaxID=182803 RepID=A0A4Y2V3V5_ARAVE|nr:hypothetical protein AVEN_171943-1 [Araneus ventricosus]